MGNEWKLGKPYPTTQEGVLERLVAANLIERLTDGYAVLNIGAVLLAKNLRSFESVWRKAPRIVVYKGDSKLNTLSDQTGEKGYAAGFQGLVQYVMGKLPQNETAELLQLPAPDFLIEYRRTVAVIYGARDFRAMDRTDRVRACYQHCVLQWVLR
ncbi:hypothetical protein [Desulfobacter sp.]|uniref:hypothetical protein n=1 Tax=Desulfobacter sp. TaxID=2294 RepID=UPI003D0E0152